MANPVFPTKRKYYPGIDNPLFLGDITTGYDSDLSVMASLSGLKDGDFYIISGLEYVLGTPNNYTPGIIYFNGDFFYCSVSLTEGLRLATSYIDVLSETFNDAVARPIYTNQVATPSSSTLGTTPAFTGNMDQYRINNKILQQQILGLLDIIGNLGTAANANLGTGPGQVPTADQVYTQTQTNALLMMRGPSVPGSITFAYDWDGTFLSNFNGSGLGIVYPWYNAATGERWGLMNGIATAGGHTAPNIAGKTFIGQGTDAGSNTFSEGTTYGANNYTLVPNNLPKLKVEIPANINGVTGSGAPKSDAADNNPLFPEIVADDGTPLPAVPTPLNMMQSSLAIYFIIRLV
jgi:hypothetical protein